ncbi:hypothetical protein NDU88_000125 [Pleurodeles waltl]|uniref:Uncharacterized protein n=1 Tax=Pleurodeles waltl TaxID=8319 RepID=A0AAV7SW25_PLEWA|nr:hypothetical protein NDU88_000125 [Pleurodeles waltl]
MWRMRRIEDTDDSPPEVIHEENRSKPLRQMMVAMMLGVLLFALLWDHRPLEREERRRRSLQDVQGTASGGRILYPFGQSMDSMMPHADDASTGPIAISGNFTLYGVTYTSLYYRNRLLCRIRRELLRD